jgi:hypothetical protein
MRIAGLLLLLTVGFFASRADEAEERMDALGAGFEYQWGHLKIALYPNSILWLNGVRQPTHDDDASVRMKPGDVLVTASPVKWHDAGEPTPLPAGDIYRYRLVSLDARHAVFTLTTFDEAVTTISPNSRRYSLGKPRTSSTFELDVSSPHYLFGLDYGTNHLEMSGSRGVPRSK